MKQKLIIHFFVQSIYKHGTFFRYHNLALGLMELGHTVRIFGSSFEKNEKSRKEVIDGIEYDITACYFPLQRFFGQSTHPFGALKRAIRKYGRCDIAHVFQPHLNGFLPWYLNRKKAKQNVYDWDDLWTDGILSNGKTLGQKWTYNQVRIIEKKGVVKSDLTTTCSEFLKQKSLKFGAVKVQILYNGFWDYEKRDKALSRKAVRLEADAFYIGFMGKAVYEDEIVDCFKLLESSVRFFPNVRLALCGMPETVLGKIDKNILEKVDYLGYLSPLATRDFASALDIGLMPLNDYQFNKSRFPIKFAEYLAAKIPVLCSDVGECSKLAKHLNFVKNAGLGRTEWIRNGIEMIDQILKGTWPVVDKQQVLKIFDWKILATQLEEAYLSLESKVR